MKMRTALAIGIWVFLISGCQRAPTIWKTEVRSPDGLWLAIAHTEQNGGFGSASIVTSVDLKRVDETVDSGKPVNVLDFWCDGPAPRPYVLNDANTGGTINLKMKWVTPSHLDVTYNGKAELNFQVVKLAGVQISVHDLSKEEESRSS